MLIYRDTNKVYKIRITGRVKGVFRYMVKSKIIVWNQLYLFDVFRPLFFLTITLFLFGCNFTDPEKKYFGTVEGVSICIEKNAKQSELVSQDLMKQQCIAKHEVPKPYLYGVKNTASIKVGEDKWTADADLYNNFNDFVITFVEIQVTYVDKDGQFFSNSGVVENIWLEPLRAKSVGLKLSATGPKYPITEKGYCSKQVKKILCKEWSIIRYKGLNIVLK